MHAWQSVLMPRSAQVGSIRHCGSGLCTLLDGLVALSTGLAYFVKYAPALVPGGVVRAWAELPDAALSTAALAVIVVPTLLNIAKWRARSNEGAEFVGDI